MTRLTLTLALILSLSLLFFVACKKEAPKPPEPPKKAQAQPVKAPEPPKKAEALPPKPEEKKIEIEPYSYDPKGRRDPFLSIIEASKREKEAEKKKKSSKPSEMYDVGDIKIIAIAGDKDRHYAMVQLPDKKYFTVREGMTLGTFGGKVIRIDSGSVTIREYIRNYKGELQPKDTTLRLRKEEVE